MSSIALRWRIRRARQNVGGNCSLSAGGSRNRVRKMRQLDPVVGAELESLQRESFGYFEHEVNSANGLVKDKRPLRQWSNPPYLSSCVTSVTPLRHLNYRFIAHRRRLKHRTRRGSLSHVAYRELRLVSRQILLLPSPISPRAHGPVQNHGVRPGRAVPNAGLDVICATQAPCI